MTPAEQAKAAGLKSLTQVSQITGQSLNTLTNWHRDKPDLYRIVLLGCLADLNPPNQSLCRLPPCRVFTGRVDVTRDKAMLYPVYIHKNDESAFGATVPDFPGCFSAADHWEDLPNKVREAVELYCEGEDAAIPIPSSIENFTGNEDFTGGQWVFVEIDTRKLNTFNGEVKIVLIEEVKKRNGQTY